MSTPLIRATRSCIWPKERLEHERGGVTLAEQAEVDPLQPWGFWAPLRWGLQFSLLSAFQIGWDWLNVGTWITRLQGREYTLQATGGCTAVGLAIVAERLPARDVGLELLWPTFWIGCPWPGS